MAEGSVPERRVDAPRCLLSSPASRPALMAKAAASAADTIMIDLEDAVFPDGKDAARAVAVDAIGRLDWRGRRVLVRINALDTQWGLRDLLDVCRVDRLDGVLVPKIESADDVRFLGRLLEGLGRDRGRALELHVLIESARAVAHVEAILGAGPLIVSASFGSGDYAISVGSLDGLIGSSGVPPDRLPFEYAKGRFVTGCHAYDVTPLDGPFPQVTDIEGCRQAARLGRGLGFSGKWAIHPGQIAVVHEEFGPLPEQRVWARRVVEALTDARSRNVGAVQMDGRLVEAAHLNLAE